MFDIQQFKIYSGVCVCVFILFSVYLVLVSSVYMLHV